jgi:hypothetical protein
MRGANASTSMTAPRADKASSPPVWVQGRYQFGASYEMGLDITTSRLAGELRDGGGRRLGSLSKITRTDVVASQFAGELRTSSWFYREEEARKLQASLYAYHGVSEKGIIELFARPPQGGGDDGLEFPRALAERILIGGVPAVTGTRRSQRCREHLAYLRRLPSRASEVPIERRILTARPEYAQASNRGCIGEPDCSPYLGYPYPCFVMKLAADPYYHCFTRFFVGLDGIAM